MRYCDHGGFEGNCIDCDLRKAQKRLRDMAELFHELREYLDQRADVVDDEAGEDGPSVSPNAAMILLGKVDKALESLEVK